MLKKEFLLIMRDRHALAALFIMPSVFILIMSMALKDTFSSDRAFINYVVIDQDRTAISMELATLLKKNRLLKEYQQHISSKKQLQQALNDDLTFAVTIAVGFSKSLGNENPAVPLTLNVASDVQQNVLRLFEGELTGILMKLRIKALLHKLEPALPGISAKTDARLLDQSSLIQVRFNDLQNSQFPTSTQQSVPSWIVFGMFFIIIPMSTIFISERRQNTLMRMNGMNISIPALFTGKIVPYMVINQIQVLLMVGVGIFIVPLLGAAPLTPGNSVTALLLVSTGLSLAAIGTSMLIAVSVNTVEQATTIGGILNILFGAIGGVMVPKFFMPPAMQSFSIVSPMSWGLEGFLDIFLRGLGPRAVVTESFALAGFGLLMLLLAWGIFARRTGKGL